MRARTRVLIASGAAIVGILVAAIPGHGVIRQFDVGYDANDRPAEGWIDPDIRATTRIVSVDDEGRRWLVIKFRTYDYLQAYWTVLVRLDVRGGPRTDVKLEMSDDGATRSGCRFLPRPGADWRRARYHFLGGRLAQVGAACLVPMGWVHAEKPIRWKLFSPKSFEEGHRVDEYAPDHGWYD